MQNYEQVKVLGEGGFGKAILARQKSDNKMCVIKEVRLSSLKQKDRNEALKEAKVLSSLNHPNIVKYITSFQERGCFYIVMEYADGGDLSQKIEKRRNKLFSEDEILHDFIQICLAIKYIHDRKILHRDLKTQNIFLTKKGDVKLGDFGIASVLEHTFQLCRTQIGTPYYLSPEICEGRSYNAKTDIWSLGCILYELCTLQHAFQAGNIKALMMNICRGKISPINRMYSDDLKALVRSMLTTDPKKRPSINQILSLHFIKSRLNSLLDKTILDYEFSHTVLHGRKPLAAPTVILSHNDEPHSLVDDYENDQKDNKYSNEKAPYDNKANKPQRPSSGIKQKEPNPSRENRPPSRQRQAQQMPQQRQNLPSGADPRYYQRQQRAAAVPDNVDPRYARRQQLQQQKIEEEQRKKEANERERQRLRQAEEQRRQKQKMKEREEEERRIQKQEEIERERRRQEEQKRQEEEKKRRIQQQQALQERRKRIQEDLEKKKEEERMRKRIEADEARRRNEEEERERQREQIKAKHDFREQQRKRREEEEADLKRRDEERKRQRLIEQQKEKEELEAEKAQLMEEEKQRKIAAMRRQRELREEQKRQAEEDRKRKQQQEEDDMKNNGYLDFESGKDQQRRRQQNNKIQPSYSENELPAKRQQRMQRPKWVDPEGRAYNDDDEDDIGLSEPPPQPKQRKPTWASSPNDDNNNQYNQPNQSNQQQRKQRPAWVSPTDNDYDNQQQQQPQRKQKPAWVSPTDDDYNNNDQNQQQYAPPRKKQKPAWVDPNGDDNINNEPQQVVQKPRRRPVQKNNVENNDFNDDNDIIEEPSWAKMPPKKLSVQQKPKQKPRPKSTFENKKFDDMTQEERNEYMRQLRHEAQANRQKANKIELEEGDNQNPQNISSDRNSSPPVQQQQQSPQKQNLMNKKFEDMTLEEKNEYARQLRHEAAANRQKAMKIAAEEGENDNEVDNVPNNRRSSPPPQQQQPPPSRPNLLNKKFDDMTQEERNEYMRQLRHEAKANRQKANKIELEEGDDQDIQNIGNDRKSSPPAQIPQKNPPPQQQQPPTAKPNIANKKFDDMTQEERNEYMRQLRHEAQANRQKANRIQLEEGDDQDIQNIENDRKSSPPAQIQQKTPPSQQQQQQPAARPNIANKKFDDMTQEERNEYMRQLRHEAQANRQKANKIQLEEGDDNFDQIGNDDRKSSPPPQQQQPRQQQPVARPNIANKKFDDMTQMERNEYMRQLRHEAQANRQKANRIQLEEGDDQDIQNPGNERKSSPPVQPQQRLNQNLMNKKFDDMTQDERNEYMRQLRHEAQANRQKANRIQLEEGDEQYQYNNNNDRKPPKQQQQQQQQQRSNPNLMNKRFEDMTQEERNEYMRQLRHEAQANRQKANRIQVEGGDDQNQYNNNARQARQNPSNINDDRIAKHEISEEDRRRIYEEQRAAFKAYRSRGRLIDNGAEAREALEDPGYVNQPPPKDDRIAKHEISEEDRRRIYEEQRAAFKAYRSRGRLIDNGGEVRDAVEDPDYVNQPPPKDERIAKHEISEEDRRRIYEEQRAAFKAYRNRGRLIDNGGEVRDAIEDPDYVNQPPPKDDRIAKHEISEEDRRRIYEEQRAAFKAYRSRGRVLDNGAEVRDAIEDPDYVNQPPPKDDRIAKHEISEEDRRRIYEEQRAAFKSYKNRGRVVDSFVEEPPISQEKKTPPKNGRPLNDPYYFDEDDEGYNFNTNLYYNKNKNKNKNQASAVAQAAMFSPEFDEYNNDYNEYNDIDNENEADVPKWAKAPTRHVSLAQQRPVPGSPRFYDEMKDDDENDVNDDDVNVLKSPPINNKVVRQNNNNNRRLIQLDNDYDNDYNEDINKTDEDVERLQHYAYSIREALNLPERNGNDFEDDDDNDNDFNDNNDQKNQIFYIHDKQVSLPVASDEESKKNRIQTMRGYLEDQIGLDKLNALNQELINKAQDDSIQTPIINNLPPGLVCLAEQLLVMDGQNNNNDNV